MIKYLDATDILVIHARVIDKTGGMRGVRDTERLEAAARRPKSQFTGKELYPTVFEKAAVYFEVLAFHHPFTDGDKRTAFVNNYELCANNKTLEKFVLDAVVKKYDVPRVAEWFKKHSQKIKS